MDTQMQTIERRLTQLEDQMAIQQLIAAYGPRVDSGDSRGAAALWAEDGVYEIGDLALARGHSEVAALFDAPMHQELIARGAAHLMGPPQIQIDGDQAVATGYSVVFRRSAAGFEVFRVAANRWELQRGAGGWQVSRRINRLLDGQDAARALLGSAMSAG
jgi:hypothetical protein